MLVLRTARLCAAICLTAALLGDAVSAQPRQVTLSGTITDATTGEPLENANVFVAERSVGAAADVDGHYSLSLPIGIYRVRYSYVGYEAQVRDVELGRDRVIDVRLEPLAFLDEVVVQAEDETAVQAPVLGITRLDPRELQRLPTFMGEVDVTRALLSLPGVTSVGEGSGGLNVRGGEVDQNLVLLDGTQIFFASHLFGLFSTFNPDLIEHVTLYRGTIPARYGGRISSVLDVQQRSGSGDRVGVRGGVGVVASRLSIEGPIAGDRLTAIIGGRASYVNWLTQLAERRELKDSRAGYADLGGRLTFRPTSRLRGYLSGYLSTDSFRFGADTTYHYDTRNVALRTAYTFDQALSLALDAAISGYSYGFGSDNILTGFAFDADVLHARMQPRLVWIGSGYSVEGGIAGDFYRLSPGTLAPVGSSVQIPVAIEREQGAEGAAFVSVDFERGPVRVEAGLRYAHWATLGPATIPVLDPEAPRGPGSVIDTTHVASGTVAADYGGFEPRLGVRFAVAPDAAVKAGYSRLRQNFHLLSNTTAPTPIDRWKLSDAYLPPQVGDQISAGMYGPLPFGLSASAELYYRWLHDVPAYRPGASLLLNPFVVADLLPGEGRAYGLELLLERPAGRVTGSMSYTLARSERRAFTEHAQEQINFGQWFPADFDRPHDLALSFAYHESPWVSWGVNFVYSSGRPITYPTGVYDMGDLVLPSYTLRNQARLPAYHRLDLSLTIDAPRPGQGPFAGRLTFAIYNVYGRRNAYSVFFRQVPGTRIPQAYRLSTFGTIFPSLTYSFEF